MRTGEVRDVDGGCIHLEDGRTLPQLSRVRSRLCGNRASQPGKDGDAVILSADAMKQELFLRRASRGRQEIVVVTSDREQLREMLGVSQRGHRQLSWQETDAASSALMRSPERSHYRPLNRRATEKDGHKHIWE